MNNEIILFSPVLVDSGSSKAHAVDLDRYSLRRRFATRWSRSKLIIEFVSTPLDIKAEQLIYLRDTMCREIPTSELYTLQIGTPIVYQRKDTGKLIVGPSIIKHTNGKNGNTWVLVGYHNTGEHLSNCRRQRIANGEQIGFTQYSGAWPISPDTIERLFVAKSQMDILKGAIIHQADELGAMRQKIIEQEAQIANLTAAVKTLKSVVASLLSEYNKN